MQLPDNTIVAVADGENFHLFKSSGSEAQSKLQRLKDPHVDGNNHSAGARHGSSASNPDEKQDAEDMYAAATADWLNRQAMSNNFEHAVIIAAPKMLGELRKHYHKTLETRLLKEIAKDLTGQDIQAVATALEEA